MANSYSTQDIVKGTLQKSGENTDGSSPYHELALKYINSNYFSILAGNSKLGLDISHPWTWARVQGGFTILPFNETGTVTLTASSAAGTFSSAPTISQAGRFLKVENEETYYEILSHTAGAAPFTLKTAYLGATGAGKAFKSIPLSYDLGAGILRLVEPFRIYVDRFLEDGENYLDKGRIYGLALDVLREKYPLRFLQQQVPARFATYKRSESEWLVYLNAFTSQTIKVDFDYIAIPEGLVDSNTDKPLIPWEFREVLEHAAAALLLLDKEEKEKAGANLTMATAIYTSMSNQEERMQKDFARNYGKLIPRQDDYQYWPRNLNT